MKNYLIRLEMSQVIEAMDENEAREKGLYWQRSITLNPSLYVPAIEAASLAVLRTRGTPKPTQGEISEAVDCAL